MSDRPLEIDQYPPSVPRADGIVARVNGQPTPVYRTNVADFLSVAFIGTAEVELIYPAPLRQAEVRPLRCNILAQVEGATVRFTLPAPRHVCLTAAGHRPLYLYAQPSEADPPQPGQPGVRYFGGGETHEVGELHLHDGETLYLAPGSVVRGRVRVADARGVRVCGRGVLDGGFARGEPTARLMVFERCRDVRVEDVLMIEPTSWMLSLGDCERVHVRNLKQIGEVVSSDGVDVCGSRDVLIEDCCLKNNDDCIAIKSLDVRPGDPTCRHDWRAEVANLIVRNCILANDRAGNVMEIGHELQTPNVRGITFQNLDVLHCHGLGAVFAIHNGDRALVQDVLFEDIHVEHYYDKLVDLRVIRSMYNRDHERGRVRNVRFKDIHVTRSVYNLGYSISLVGGWDEAHRVEDVSFENFRLGGETALDADALDLHTRHAVGLTFR